jgi:hypothetical protein
MAYNYPTSKDEYWKIVDTYWDNLYNILVRFLPKEKLIEADNLRLIKSPELASLFNTAWANAPDHISIHSIPSWHVLCDLCSESYVLHEDE